MISLQNVFSVSITGMLIKVLHMQPYVHISLPDYIVID